MQFEICEYVRRFAADIGQMSGIAADKRDAVTKSLTAAGGLIQFGVIVCV